MEIGERVGRVRERFLAGFGVSERRARLKALGAEIRARSADIEDALKADFNKSGFESYATEIGLVLGEIRYMIKNLARMTRAKRVRTSLMNFPSKGMIYAEGYGVVLVIAPWNYPFQLALNPLIGAVAAGNTVVLKPASATKETARVIAEIVAAVFPEDEAFVFRGTRADAAELVATRFDYIFFTGGAKAGREIMLKAAENLTPVSLELGGKSPCIVDESADIALAAKRIVWGKFLNAGQTCIAPDYVLAHNNIVEELTARIIENIKNMYYSDGELGADFPYLVSESKAEEMKTLLSGADIAFGGAITGRRMEPTVIVNADYSSPIMQAEIFAPVMPILTFTDLDAAIDKVNALERPLALYYFGKNGERAVRRAKFGGGCVNDCIMHVSEEGLPFGGVGMSGMGRYHGQASFDTFTHYKSVLIKGKLDIPVRYPPYTEKKKNMMKRFMK